MYPNNSERIKDWHERQAQRQAAWQSPETIISAITPLILALETHPSICFDLGIENPYFTSGCFRQNLMEMVKMLDWCIANNIEKVRITLV